jgi:AcrR family transcriptional regulator
VAVRVSKKEEQSARSREALLAAATDLFAERGYREASVQAIGERAGVSRGSIFWHFGSKEGLLWAVVERAFARWEREVLVPDVGGARGLKAIRRGLAAHRRFLSSDEQALRLFFVLIFEALGPRPELAAEFARLHAHLRELTVGWLRGADDIREDVDPQAVMVIITATLGGIVYQRLLDPRGFDLDLVYRDLEATLVRGLGRR